jgi:hypothetical protein
MSKWRKKSIVIEAEQFYPEPIMATSEMFMEYPVQKDERGYFLVIPTLEGNHRADMGDWIITGIKGEKYPCKPDIFEETYEPDYVMQGFYKIEDDNYISSLHKRIKELETEIERQLVIQMKAGSPKGMMR